MIKVKLYFRNKIELIFECEKFTMIKNTMGKFTDYTIIGGDSDKVGFIPQEVLCYITNDIIPKPSKQYIHQVHTSDRHVERQRS